MSAGAYIFSEFSEWSVKCGDNRYMKDVRCVYSLYIITIDINGTAYWNEIANAAGKLKYNNKLH